MPLQGNQFLISADTEQESKFMPINGRGTVNIDAGTGVATLTLQVKRAGQTAVVNIDTIASSAAGSRTNFTSGEGDEWQVICESGDYTSGTVTGNIQGLI